MPDEDEEEKPVPPTPPARTITPKSVEPAVAPVVPVVTPPAPSIPAVAPTEIKELQADDSDLLDVNTASDKEFQVLGFSAVQSKNIVRYRKKVGRFNTVDDILLVPGVDAKTLENVRESLTAR